MADDGFVRKDKAGAVLPCESPCGKARARDDQISTVVRMRIESSTGRPEPATGLPSTDGAPMLMSADADECTRRALTLGPTLRRFNRYREALPYARAADDMNKLGNEAGDEQPEAPCLTRLPVDAEELNKELGLPPGTLKENDLRNDSTGFRAALYRDEGTGKLVLVARDTQPKSLVDWQTNTRNGEGLDTDQYSAMRRLARRLTQKGLSFDVAGYSKGGGLAQEATLVSPNAKAYVFNSAGLHHNSLARTGNTDFASLAQRTQAFSSENDFLTYMNDTRDPRQQIENARFLRGELAGENRWFPDPMQIDHRNPALLGLEDPDFEQDRDAYLGELDRMIGRMEADHAAGRSVSSFPPVRAAQRETIPGSSSGIGNFLGAGKDGPNLGKLAQHQMKNVLGPMEKALEKDRAALQAFLDRCG